jgi:hypothetical protein
MATIEEERDEWLAIHNQSRVIHSIEDTGGRHRVVLSTQDYDDSLQKEAKGVGTSYLEALLVALRNWESEWKYLERR